MSQFNKPSKGSRKSGRFKSPTLKRKTSANEQVANLRFSNKNKTQDTSADKKQLEVLIDSLDWMGQGVARTTPVHFVEGALPGELCHIAITQAKKNVISGKAISIAQPSESRVEPFCPVFNQCGGCQLQHIEQSAALSQRDDALRTMLEHQLGMEKSVWQRPLEGDKPAYRRKARLAIDARRNGDVKLGFRAQSSNDIVDVESCPVLVTELSKLIAPLRELVSSCESSMHIGHISLLAGDNVSQVTIKHTKALSPELYSALVLFGEKHSVNIALENKKGRFNLIHLVAPLVINSYDGYTLSPAPNDFVQVNNQVNNKMIEQALAWLDPQPHERIADWFSGLGNFTLSLAKRGATVQAVEGVAEMVQRAQENAHKQGVDSVQWRHLDLSNKADVESALGHGFDKVLLDPSREGALTVCQALVNAKPKSIVYVSCNPSTFARDAAVLIQGGYQMKKAGAVEMFPFTHHMEMMALFTR